VPYDIEPERAYTPRELEERGLARVDTLAVQRYRTRRTGRQHGPRWSTWGRRVVYRGRDVLEYLGLPVEEVA
jgi:hypothetical protein